MTILVSIDPGKSTGIAVGTYSETEPFDLKQVFQIEGGVEGFVKDVRVNHGEDWGLNLYGVLYIGRKGVDLYSDREQSLHSTGGYCDDGECYDCFETVRDEATVVVEKFTARGSGNGFSYRTDALEPLRVEGAILAMGIRPIWRSPQHQYIAGGKGSEAKKRQAAWLKEHGFYVTGKTVGCKDADDARSATAHALSYLRSIKHKPTLDKYFRED